MTTQVNTFEKNIKSLKVGTLKVDKIIVGKEWVAFTPTLTNHTANASATKTWKYKIEGTTLYVKGYYLHAASGTHTNGNYAWSYPTGCTVLSANTAHAGGSAYIVGGTTQVNGVVLPSTGGVGVQIPITATTAGAYGPNANTPADIRFDVNAALLVGMSYVVELDPTCAALAGNPVP